MSLGKQFLDPVTINFYCLLHPKAYAAFELIRGTTGRAVVSFLFLHPRALELRREIWPVVK